MGESSEIDGLITDGNSSRELAREVLNSRIMAALTCELIAPTEQHKRQPHENSSCKDSVEKDNGRILRQ